MRKNINLSEAILSRAMVIIAARSFAGLSDLVAALVREEHERRNLPMASSAKGANSEVLGLVNHASEEPGQKPKRKKKRKPGRATPGQ